MTTWGESPNLTTLSNTCGRVSLSLERRGSISRVVGEEEPSGGTGHKDSALTISKELQSESYNVPLFPHHFHPVCIAVAMETLQRKTRGSVCVWEGGGGGGGGKGRREKKTTDTRHNGLL